jgi:hypothetical protein
MAGNGSVNSYPAKLVTPGRFELPTCGLGNRRSIHLSYGVSLAAMQTDWLYFTRHDAPHRATDAIRPTTHERRTTVINSLDDRTPAGLG